ncbi:hypothetical protein GC173_08165 [bacterium]|nr:hypothetical protein [bacterium]
MFPYNNRIADYTAAFPGAVYTPLEMKNENTDGELLSESGMVPAAADFEGRRRLNLNQVPVEQLGMSVTVDGSPRQIVPHGEAPAEGQVAVSMVTGVLDFHASDAGLAVAVDYRGKGTPVMAFAFHQVGKELAATQTKLLSVENEMDELAEDVGALEDEVAIKQDGDPLLTAIAALTTAADQLVYTTGSDAVALTALTAFARGLLAATDAAAARSTIGALGGGLGVTDKALLRADGTGGATAQGSTVTVTDGGGLRTGYGSTTAPAWSFGGETNKGFYSPSGGSLGFVAGSTEYFRFEGGSSFGPIGASRDLGGTSMTTGVRRWGTVYAVAGDFSGALSCVGGLLSGIRQTANQITVIDDNRTLLSSEAGSVVVVHSIDEDCYIALPPTPTTCSPFEVIVGTKDNGVRVEFSGLTVIDYAGGVLSGAPFADADDVGAVLIVRAISTNTVVVLVNRGFHYTP